MSKNTTHLYKLCLFCGVLCLGLVSCYDRADSNDILPSLEAIKAASTQHSKELKKQEQMQVNGNYVIPQAQPETSLNSGYTETLLFARNTNVRIVNNIGFYVKSLIGRLTANQPDNPLPLDNPQAFTLDILQGDVVLNAITLEDIFNNHIFNYPSAPLKDLKIQTQDNLIKLSGKALRKGVFIPIELSARPTVHEGRYLIMNTVSLSLEGNSATTLLKIGRIELDELLTINTPAVKLKGSTIWIDTANLLPPPKMNLQIDKVAVDAQGIHLKLKKLADIAFPTPRTNRDSYMIIRGGDMRLVRLLTLNAELNIISKQKGEDLDFCFYQYRKQVNEGFLNLLEDGSAIVYLENYKYLDK